MIFCDRRLEAKPQICSPFPRERDFFRKEIVFFLLVHGGQSWFEMEAVALMRRTQIQGT